MDEAGALQLAVTVAEEVAAGVLDEQTFAESLVRVFGADAGVGFTVWIPSERPGPHLVSAGCDPMSYERSLRAAAFVATHPGFVGMRRVGTSESVLLSHEVPLRRFWGTESWEAMHGHSDGRFPMSALLYQDSRVTAFIGLHRKRRDFTVEEAMLLSRVQQPIAAAYRYRAMLEAAAARVAALYNPAADGEGTVATRKLPESPTQREAEVLALIVAGRTNVQIANELHITERTVRKHLSAMYEKAHLPGRAAAAAWWTRHRDEFTMK